MPNHFHLLISTDLSLETLTKLTSNLAISYSKSYNKLYKRKGALFLRKCKLKLIDPGAAVPNVMMYIHRNPVHHRFVNDYEDWPFSSYKEFIANAHVYTSNQNMGSFFDSVENYIAKHKAYKDKWELEKSLENFD